MVNWTLIKADDNYLNVLYRHSPAEKSGKTVKFSLRKSKDLNRIPRIKLQKSKVLPPFWIWYSWSSLYIILRYITFTVDSLLFNNLQIFYLFSLLLWDSVMELKDQSWDATCHWLIARDGSSIHSDKLFVTSSIVNSSCLEFNSLKHNGNYTQACHLL